MPLRNARGFGLIDIMVTLVVICGLVIAANYYRGRPVDDPTKIDTSLPDFSTESHKSGASYYLEGTVTRVTHNEAGAYFRLKAPNDREYWVVGTKAHSGGIKNVAAGQVAMMKVQPNTGPSLTNSMMVAPGALAPEAFVYQYLVKTATPAGYKDPHEEEERAATKAEAKAAAAAADDKDDD
ncbi:hypothetical protein [Usitatibacter palustris]|uniref:Uncharacterized protein n=1 Tax=Usitatibacter palustris TaxID=2732487 RepID=A0A6M4H6L6_9PROT|nr:hypothetical protein [Usitatibacter palustris]QJR14303.1 hypothetical protein DSM104440_01097 [Usitatibacter palustris]